MFTLGSPFLTSVAQELRDHIYSFLFSPALATTQHPFTECPLPPRRFTAYTAVCLINRQLYHEARFHFTKLIAPNINFFFTSTASLRAFQYYALHHRSLRNANGHIRCGTGIGPNGVLSPLSTTETVAIKEKVESLIHTQPGYQRWMCDVPGFYRSRPSEDVIPSTLLTNNANAWKPRKRGLRIIFQTGGEICDAQNCYQRGQHPQDRGAMVTAMHYPPLREDIWTDDAHLQDLLEGPAKGNLSLSCYIWTKEVVEEIHMSTEVSILTLEGKLRDVWVPQDIHQVERRHRAHHASGIR